MFLLCEWEEFLRPRFSDVAPRLAAIQYQEKARVEKEGKRVLGTLSKDV